MDFCIYSGRFRGASRLSSRRSLDTSRNRFYWFRLWWRQLSRNIQQGFLLRRLDHQNYSAVLGQQHSSYMASRPSQPCGLIGEIKQNSIKCKTNHENKWFRLLKPFYISSLYKFFVHILFIVLNSRFMTNTKFFLPFILHDFIKGSVRMIHDQKKEVFDWAANMDCIQTLWKTQKDREIPVKVLHLCWFKAGGSL